MDIRLSSHGAYNHHNHIVWIPKYRKEILRGELKAFIEEKLPEIQEYYPDIEVEKFNIRIDHVHTVIIIPPKYSVSSIVGKIKANTSRQIREQFPWLKKIYRGNEFWSPGFFSSTVGIDEATIKRYVEFQEKIDKGQVKLKLPLNFK